MVLEKVLRKVWTYQFSLPYLPECLKKYCINLFMNQNLQQFTFFILFIFNKNFRSKSIRYFRLFDYVLINFLFINDRFFCNLKQPLAS